MSRMRNSAMHIRSRESAAAAYHQKRKCQINHIFRCQTLIFSSSSSTLAQISLNQDQLCGEPNQTHLTHFIRRSLYLHLSLHLHSLHIYIYHQNLPLFTFIHQSSLHIYIYSLESHYFYYIYSPERYMENDWNKK